jgi:hypothetical protein
MGLMTYGKGWEDIRSKIPCTIYEMDFGPEFGCISQKQPR